MDEVQLSVRTLNFSIPEDFFSKSSVLNVYRKNNRLIVKQEFLNDDDVKKANEYSGFSKKRYLSLEGRYYYVSASNPIETYIDDLFSLILELSKGNGYIILDVHSNGWVRIFKEVISRNSNTRIT